MAPSFSFKIVSAWCTPLQYAALFVCLLIVLPSRISVIICIDLLLLSDLIMASSYDLIPDLKDGSEHDSRAVRPAHFGHY